MEESIQNNEVNEDNKENSSSKCVSKVQKFVIGFIFELLVILLFELLGFKYELVSTDNNIYRINQITGDVKLIKGTRFVHIDNITESGRLGLSKVKKLDEITIPKHNLTCSLEILWRSDNLYYNFKVSPYNAVLKKLREGYYFESINKGFNIELYDENGFVIAEIPIKINEMTGIVDENNKTSELQKKGKIFLSYEDMKLIKNWSTTWNF